MKLSPKARAALDKVVDQFKSGDLSPIVEIACIQRDAIPSDKWSLSNRILAYMQTGSADCRGYRQWQKASRHVKKGSRAAFILAPVMVPIADPKTGEKVPVLRGFRAVPVFACHDTDGEDLPVTHCAPIELPPLTDVAERFGVKVTYTPLPSDRYGSCTVDGKQIRLGTQDTSVFLHELAHAAHAKIEGKLKGSQDAVQETVAEFTAAVLMHLCGLPDRSGNCWQYIAGYATDPLQAIVKALNTVEEVLGLLLAA